MIEIIILAVVLTIIAGLWDLKTTEVPDQLLYAMIAIGVIYWVANWALTGDANSVIISLSVGTLLLGLGLIMYKKGQWGGADAWILAAIGYMIPLYNGEVFIVPYLLNFVIVSIIYSVIYSIILGLMHRDVFQHFKKDLRSKRVIVLGVPGILLVLTVVVALARPLFTTLFINLFVLFTLLILFWRYAVVLEANVFKKKIPTRKLKVGDVMEKGNWIGLTERQIKSIRKQKRFVVIKDGMRFVPVFAIALVLTLLFGNLFFLIF